MAPSQLHAAEGVPRTIIVGLLVVATSDIPSAPLSVGASDGFFSLAPENETGDLITTCAC
jgi:hypothetical protein